MDLHSPVVLSSFDDKIAMEKGRLLAAQALAHNPEQRKRFEDKFGIEYAKQRYPEVYAPSPFEVPIVDKIQFLRSDLTVIIP